MKLWEKNYSLNKQIEKFTVDDDYIIDQKLIKYDCAASIAHVKMLAKIGTLSKGECNKIIEGLNKIIKLDSKGKFTIKQEDEDCHTAIENYLTKNLGKVGKKIHTARSRNDQVLTALRLYYKDEIKTVLKLIDNLVGSLLILKEKYGNVEMPGYTHMRKAMPSSVSLWASAFTESMKDNKILLSNVYKLIDQSPLGTGAGYGLPIQTDRKLTAELLGFKKIQKNPIYVQNSRGKFEADILHMLSQIMLDLNKMSSDIILFSMPEFGYFELASDICTGSSIMPNKENPDVLELIRAKYHKIVALEFEIKSTIGNLISGYNRDIQLTKKSTIEACELVELSLETMKIVLDGIKINKKNCKRAMSDELFGTEKAYQLVKKGIPFREAYKEVSKNHE